MSSTLSVNAGSPEGLKVSERCGCSRKAFRMRRTVVCGRPPSPPIRPMGGVGRSRVWRPLDDVRRPVVPDGPRASRPGPVRQPVGAVLREPTTPFADRLPVGAQQFQSHHLVRHTLGAAQDHAATFGQGTRHLPSAGLTLREGPLRPVREQGRHGRPTPTAIPPTPMAATQ